MICPLKLVLATRDGDNKWLGDGRWDCMCDECQWWDSKASFNSETKEFEGQCCILTLARLKISGGINTHPY